MSYIFINQNLLQIRLDTKIDLTNAATMEIRYRKPSGTTGAWSAARYGSTTQIYYDLSATELDEVGLWTLWSYVVMNTGRKGYGKICTQMVSLEGSDR
jgi:hypothetical protein